MKQQIHKNIDNIDSFLERCINYSHHYSFCQLLSTAASSNHKIVPDKFRFILALGIKERFQSGTSERSGFKQLQALYARKEWVVGYMGYDMKNETEALISANPDHLEFPEWLWVIPELIIYSPINSNEVILEGDLSENQLQNIFSEITKQKKNTPKPLPNVVFTARDPKQVYLEKIKAIQSHIQAGDIYEMNYCQEFFAKEKIDPTQVYQKLSSVSPTPFGAFLRNNTHALMCASPERFLTKIGDKIFSQPIKGTIKRGQSSHEDRALSHSLYQSEKDRAENVMIVDLVRNDLSHHAAKGSVQVDELFGIYSFAQVHQMISTISCTLAPGHPPSEAIKAAFPMGSMTGAPKLKAMELIEHFEETKRGLYSGAVGYISPTGDFDFNVVIRSLLYNKQKNYLSFFVGGAITILSDAEAEYNECNLKAEAMLKTFRND